MNRWQKMAWFNLIVALTALASSVLAVVVLKFIVGVPMLRALNAFSFLGIAGLTALGPLVFRKDNSKVSYDERDELFGKRAALGGFSSCCVFYVVIFIATHLIVGSNGSVSIKAFGLMLLGGYITYALVWAIAILVQYGQGGKENE